MAEKQATKPPSAASQKPPSKPPSAASQKPPSKPPSVASEKQPSKPPSAASQKPPSKPPSALSQPPSDTEKTPSENPPPASRQSKQRSKQGSQQSQRSVPSERRRTPGGQSLQSAGHPFPRRHNTHIGVQNTKSLPGDMSRSHSLPQKLANSEPPPSVSHRKQSPAPSPFGQQTTPRGSIRLDPLGSQTSMQTLTLGPMTGSKTSLDIPDPLHEPGKLISSNRYLDQITDETIAPRPEDQLPRERYFSATSVRSKKELEPLPKIEEMKEPKHPRNKYIKKKIEELEMLNKKLKDGPWGDDQGLRPKVPDIRIEGPYSLDEVKYDVNDPPVRLTTTPDPQNIISVIKSRFQLPPAFDPETGQVKEEIARAAAIMTAVGADPRESRPNPDPTGPSLCDCCEDMNDHNRNMADLERADPRPRVVQAKKLEETLGKIGTQAMGYYRSDSPTLIPVSTYMDRDLASDEMLKVGVAETMVNRLKAIAKPHSLPASQVPWPFYAHDFSNTTDLNAYLDTGMPITTDAILTVNLGQANSRYKDSMDRLSQVLKKF